MKSCSSKLHKILCQLSVYFSNPSLPSTATFSEIIWYFSLPRSREHHGIWNNFWVHCLFIGLFRVTTEKNIKSLQTASNGQNIIMAWCHLAFKCKMTSWYDNAWHITNTLLISGGCTIGDLVHDLTGMGPTQLIVWLFGCLILHYVKLWTWIMDKKRHAFISSFENTSEDKRVIAVFSCDLAALWMVFSVCLSVCPSHLFDYVPIILSSWNFQELSPRTRVTSMQKVKVRGQRSRSQRSRPNLTVSGL